VVNLPEGWEFLAEEPASEWDVPRRFRDGTKSPLVQLIIEMVQSDLSGNDVVAACGRLLSSYSEFNQWLAMGGHRALGFEGVTRASSSISTLSAAVFSAWTAYGEVRGSDPRRQEGKTERDLLLSALDRASDALAIIEHEATPPENGMA
jgi:hypothetical protein